MYDNSTRCKSTTPRSRYRNKEENNNSFNKKNTSMHGKMKQFQAQKIPIKFDK